jgi:signal transduction histidine kinase
MPLRSFRSRLLLGSILATAGLLPLGHMFSIALIHRNPGMQFRGTVHATMLAVVAVGLLVAGLLQLRSGLSPFDELRARLAALRQGLSRRVEGSYPTEVQPLVNDLNDLLDDRERAIRRALAKAGDLAHGLKTPLAVLSQEAEIARAAGHTELAATVSQQVARMRRQIDHQLALARAAAPGVAPGARCPVAASAEGLCRTLSRLYGPRGLTIDVNVSPDHSVRGQREDLDEMLGNLLDNACKWARSRVAIESSQDDAAVVITVDDDGPGLDSSLLEVVLQRGARADEAAPGSGLGLAIVRDLVELYGGSIALGASPLGGLRALLRLPAR